MRIAIAQLRGHPADVAANIAAARTEAERAKALGASLLILPETYLTGYDIGEDAWRLAEAADGPSHAAMGEVARDNAIALLYGHVERAGDGPPYNAAKLLDRSGRTLLDYRKTHLFGMEENRLYRPGEAIPDPVALDGLRVGVLICYDVEFPEAVRSLAARGADLVCVPTALMKPYSIVPDVLIPARAWENQLFVAYADRCGRERTIDYEGKSTVAAPDGSIIARAGDGEEMIVADIDPGRYATVKAHNPYLADRRPALYGD